MFRFECTAKVIIQTEEKVLSEKEKALIALEVEQELNNIGYYETIEGKKIGIRCHFFREEEEMKNIIIIEEIPEYLGGGWSAYRKGAKHLSGDGDTPDMALEDFEILEEEIILRGEYNKFKEGKLE